MPPSSCCSPTAAVEQEPAPPVAKFHTSLNVTDLTRSVAFYELLLGCGPVKQRKDYAKFELEEPPLVLSLIPGRPGGGGPLNHFGLREPTSEKLVATQRRLEHGGIRTTREEGVECCYARQTKFWVADPDKVMWEIYVFHEDIEEHGDGEVPDAASLPGAAPTSTAAPVLWQHQIPDPLPAKLDLPDHSVDEAVLEGSLNLHAAGPNLPLLLKEVLRVLKPGKQVRLHGLTADIPLTEPLPPLPGPAAVVERVPSHQEVVNHLQEAGFAEIRLEKLSTTAHFTVGGTGLREFLAIAAKPGYRSSSRPHAAVYLGPLKQVEDDFGNSFPRGARVALNPADWQALQRSSAAESFLLL
jgi:catechol 2,3-dioxygenase-like lactoylglutathione lyase family enzyme